jgi:crotonobetainyl-CoA:carnitine CoA-transferase CaiB-like acyl-CoA transferase
MAGPLSGLKVLDIATVIAGPFAAALFADYGADVTKVELPGKGDPIRDFPPFKEGKSLWWKVTNRSKNLISLDLRKYEGREIFKKLLGDYDVLIENFRPGTLDGWGLSREVLWEIQPRLVILRVTGFGQDGPYASRPGFARVFEATSGLTYITGHADREPLHMAYPLADPIGGVFGAAGALAALWRIARDPVAKGEEIDLSMTEATFRLLDVLPVEYDQLGVVRERCGNANVYSAPANVYRTSDEKYVTLAGSTQAIFRANLRAIGREDLAGDPRFSSNSVRVRNADAIDTVFRDWAAAHTSAQVLDAFTKAGGAIAPVLSSADIANDPQFRARNAIVQVPDEDFGSIGMPCVVPRFPQSPTEIRHSAGEVGEANQRTYRKLGYSDADLVRLRDSGVI